MTSLQMLHVSGIRLALRLACLICAVLCVLPAEALAVQSPPDLGGAWGPSRGGRGGPPGLAPPPPSPIVLKSPFAETWEERQRAQTEATARGEPLATPASLCIPYGMPTMMSVAIYPIEITQTPAQVTIVTEAFSEVRRAFLDRPQAPIDEVAPGYYGRSVGHWEGDTLVIDTVGIKESVEYQRIPHSNQMRITERIRLVAPDMLHDEITIEDPLVLEMPFTYTLAYLRIPDYETVEFICDNNREYRDEQGAVRLRLGND